MPDTTGGGGTDFTSPKGGLFGGLITAPTATDRDTLNTKAQLAGMRCITVMGWTAPLPASNVP